jgi:hypothetical protein
MVLFRNDGIQLAEHLLAVTVLQNAQGKITIVMERIEDGGMVVGNVLRGYVRVPGNDDRMAILGCRHGHF